MTTDKERDAALDGLIHDLQVFIELSFQKDETRLREWISETINHIEGRCWIRKQCDADECPAYRNECGRCWLIAGTMCGGRVQGKFAEKYGFCTECEIYLDVVGDDRVRKLRELVISLIHSLRLKQQALNQALSEVKVLSGLLPICMSCKKIRDDKGYWNQIEIYIRERSDAEFSHGICPDCIEKLYPGLLSKGNRPSEE